MNEPNHRVEAVIHPGGRIEFKILGIPGAGCKPIAKKIARALGMEVDEDKATSEFYVVATTDETTKVKT